MANVKYTFKGHRDIVQLKMYFSVQTASFLLEFSSAEVIVSKTTRNIIILDFSNVTKHKFKGKYYTIVVGFNGGPLKQM